MNIRDVMHQPVKCCDSSASLDQVASEMWNDDLGIVPIVDQEHRLLGVVTDRDIAMAATLKHKPLWEIEAGELIAGKPCHFCKPGDDVHHALEVMGSARIRRVPVVDDDQYVTGMVGLKDLAEHIQTAPSGKQAELSAQELLETFRQTCKPYQLQVSA